MMSLICLFLGHVPMLERRQLRLRCQRCGRVSPGVTLDRRYQYRYALPDGRFRMSERVNAWLRAKARAERAK